MASELGCPDRGLVTFDMATDIIGIDLLGSGNQRRNAYCSDNGSGN